MYTPRFARTLFCLVAIVSFAGCQSIPVHKVHFRLLEEQSGQLPVGKAILLPIDIKVKEMTASGITEVVPDWTKSGMDNFQSSLERSKETLVEPLVLVKLPQLSAEEKTLLEQYIALNETVVANAIGVTGVQGGAAWTHKSEHFDYTIGPGLSFLAEKTGADRAIMLTGEDVRSSGGRKAAFVMLAALGVGIPLGYAVTIANIIDLRSGDILWMDYHVSTAGIGYMTPENTDQILRELFTDYPGIEPYRKWLSAKE